MHVLLVEDGPTISRFLLRGLREENHVVDLAEDADTASRMHAASEYDAILLDVMLPGGVDGFDVCRRLRAAGLDTPVLMPQLATASPTVCTASIWAPTTTSPSRLPSTSCSRAFGR